ncbi:MAG: tRNA uracil 4-sulfurtransferase ThiI [Coriobacteriia bacterium]|nr:tRNA uracil 4-sulfurtransferase ThiI [Coriobacteriia bacterium]
MSDITVLNDSAANAAVEPQEPTATAPAAEPAAAQPAASEGAWDENAVDFAGEPAFQRIVLIHYHEIGLKGHNRSVFEKRLMRNLEVLLEGFPLVTIHRVAGRLVIFLKEGTTHDVMLEVAQRCLGVPGVARVSSGFKCDRDLDLMGKAAVQALGEAGDFHTFKVASRRNHTDFPTRSPEMNQIFGATLCRAFPEKGVKMKEPDVTVGIEVVQNASYIYAWSQKAIGGLPVGSAGRVVCLLSSGIDSPVATWRMARRGAVCIGVHFSGRPQTSDASEYLVDDIAHVLERTGCIGRVYVVPFGDYQREISLLAPPSLRVILYRRLMFKVAERIAERERAGALVTGESLGQVASQTLDNIRCTDAAVDMPVFRPLIGTDKLEIITMAEEVGTFEISSMDAPDCCTLFMPRNPETHAKLEDVLAAEAELPLEQWIDELVELAEVTDYKCPSYKPRKAAQ